MANIKTDITPKSQRKLIRKLVDKGYITPQGFRLLHPHGCGVFTHLDYLERVNTYANDSQNKAFHYKLLAYATKFDFFN